MMFEEKFTFSNHFDIDKRVLEEYKRKFETAIILQSLTAASICLGGSMVWIVVQPEYSNSRCLDKNVSL